MKKILLSLTLLLLCTACASPRTETPSAASPAVPTMPLAQSSAGTPAPDDWEAILSSYYAAREKPAFVFIQKNRIRRFMTEHWTPVALGIRNQQWHYDSFAEYVILDDDGAVLSDDLYYCAFSADEGRYGFIVVKYFEMGPSVQNQGVTETESLYDLQALSQQILTAMDGAGVDLSAATATRGRLGSDEIILFTQSDGGRSACSLATFEVTFL